MVTVPMFITSLLAPTSAMPVPLPMVTLIPLGKLDGATDEVGPIPASAAGGRESSIFRLLKVLVPVK